jgi:threonine/homoserine/homoserine lactone efflux protein
MSDFVLLGAFWAAFALALTSPGPNFFAMMAIAFEAGRPTAIRTAIGITIGEAFWGFGAVFGVAALSQEVPELGHILNLAGGAFLIWLGIQSLRSALRRDDPGASLPGQPAAQPGMLGGILRGLGLMFLNAKAGVFWVSLASVMLAGAGREFAALGVAGAVLMSFAWHMLLAFAFSTERISRIYRKLRRGLDFALGALLAALGIRLLVLQ